MSGEPITLTDRDYRRLSEMAHAMRPYSDGDTARCLDLLEGELARAVVLGADEAPEGIVTMDSRIQFCDVDTGETLVYTVTWPEMANPDEQKVSVLAPIGMALLGTSVGQVIEWPVPAGKRRFRVMKVLRQRKLSGAASA